MHTQQEQPIVWDKLIQTSKPLFFFRFQQRWLYRHLLIDLMKEVHQNLVTMVCFSGCRGTIGVHLKTVFRGWVEIGYLRHPFLNPLSKVQINEIIITEIIEQEMLDGSNKMTNYFPAKDAEIGINKTMNS